MENKEFNHSTTTMTSDQIQKPNVCPFAPLCNYKMSGFILLSWTKAQFLFFEYALGLLLFA